MSDREREIRGYHGGATKKRSLVAGALLLLLPFLLLGGFRPGQDFDSRLKSIVKPHRFSIARWEAQTIPGEIKQLIVPGRESAVLHDVKDEIATVTRYFSLTEQIKALKSNNQLNSPSSESELNRLQEQKVALTDTVERILEKQIRETLDELGIFNPLVGLQVRFPAVNFKLETPPNLLVISPRDRIESVREITLQPALVRKDIDEIESRADGLGGSSLVVKLGGLGATYPTLVTDEASLPSVIETGVHEWLHQYLAFEPLGFSYLLDLTGLRRNYDVAVMNETLAGMLGKEIGEIVYKKYYAYPYGGVSQNLVTAPEFDFDREMREIRRTVDSYLARGEIEPAEEFMQERREYLVTKGYNIRKLNQAYFAFYDTYADSPTSINPIGTELRTLRAKSDSIKDFLDTASAMTSRHELKQSIK